MLNPYCAFPCSFALLGGFHDGSVRYNSGNDAIRAAGVRCRDMCEATPNCYFSFFKAASKFNSGNCYLESKAHFDAHNCNGGCVGTGSSATIGYYCPAASPTTSPTKTPTNTPTKAPMPCVLHTKKSCDVPDWNIKTLYKASASECIEAVREARDSCATSQFTATFEGKTLYAQVETDYTSTCSGIHCKLTDDGQG